ncbi:MAG: hypothetical protein ACOWYE_11430 [Desulfatiglandales bacterium]
MTSPSQRLMHKRYHSVLRFHLNLAGAMILLCLVGCALPLPVPREQIPARDIFPVSIEKYRRQAIEQERRGDLQRAITSWRVVQGLKPDDINISKKMADLKIKARNGAETHFTKGVELIQKNAFRSARREFLTALFYDPDHDQALSYLKDKSTRPEYLTYVARGGETPERIARDVYKDGEKAFVVAYFNDLSENERLKQGVALKLPKIEVPPNRGRQSYAEDDRLGKARTLFNQQRYGETLTFAGDILKENPTNSEVRALIDETHYQWGMELLRKRNFSGALNAFKNLAPDFRDVASLMAQIQQLLLKEAEDHYTKGVEYFLSQDLEAATLEFEKTLRLNPDHPKAGKDLERTQRLREQLERLQ